MSDLKTIPTNDAPDAARVPPVDEAAESAVIACCLLDVGAADEALRLLRPQQFHTHPWPLIFQVITDLRSAGAPTDLPAVGGKLTTAHGAAGAAALDALTQLIDVPVAVGSVAYYASRVRQGWCRRQTGYALDEARRGLDDHQALADVLRRLQADLIGVGEDGAVESGDRPALVCVADVEHRPVEWLWPGRIPVGKVSLLAGDPGLGKSLLSLDIAARVSRGGAWPDGNRPTAGAACVIILSAEDDTGDTVRPRLEAAGADLDRVSVLEGVRGAGSAGAPARAFRLDTDLPVLEEAVAETPGCRLIIIDPVSAHLGRIDSHVNAEVRGALAALRSLAERTRVAILAVAHLNKSGGGPALYRVTGSLAFTAAARAVWAVTKDGDNPQRRLVLPVKNNLAADGTGLAFATVEPPDWPGVPVVAWERDPVQVTADDALAAPEPGEERRAVRDATDWLRDVLGDGPVGTKELQRLARDAGHAWRTCRRAKGELRVEVGRVGFGSEGQWQWALPIGGRPIGGQPYPHETLDTFGHLGHLWTGGPENAVSGGADTPQKPIGGQGPGVGHLCGSEGEDDMAFRLRADRIGREAGFITQAEAERLALVEEYAVDGRG